MYYALLLCVTALFFFFVHGRHLRLNEPFIRFYVLFYLMMNRFACIVSFYGIGFSLHSLPGSFFLNYQLVM